MRCISCNNVFGTLKHWTDLHKNIAKINFEFNYLEISAPKETDLLAADPSPKLSGVPELENNYYLRSTPRKLVGMLDEWDTRWDNVIIPEQVSQLSVVRYSRNPW